eukprot:2903261-Lingulodinium_polyedra.AAC.1
MARAGTRCHTTDSSRLGPRGGRTDSGGGLHAGRCGTTGNEGDRMLRRGASCTQRATRVRRWANKL